MNISQMTVFILFTSVVFWGAIIMMVRKAITAHKVINNVKAKANRQEQVDAPVEAATPKGPGIMYRSTLLFFKGIKWTTPRLFAGIRKVSRFTFMVSKAGGKAAVGKYNAYRTNKVTKAKATVTHAVPVSPVVNWDQYEQPAFQRVRNASADQHHQIH
ncbi:conserved protein of unknown function [Acidithiobacillus ferrivorans]|uniref:Uncharacterized protein n=1 Tax=Acidithiobacillus ferrivorans TaxID=160808 RepID=A0A060UU02_9PROT|nr:hypothetical protein [Acidithiobacillus ferrivorans]CDQ12082.1 conserved hypothetical protein [Acidithiobacillus ferrivorans]SMH64791.1 conserved protein of unknown function [Acidithiobacillus ferrivorans]